MTPLQQTALNFCRECLGYDTAKLHPNGDLELLFVPPRGFNDFRYTDLNAVMESAREWCGRQSLTLTVTSLAPTTMFRWRVQITSDAYTLDNDLCLALMQTCLDANGKLREAA